MSEELKPYQHYSHLTHGHTVNGEYSSTYSSWQCMMARCRYKHRDTENKHINRGITVCKEWLKFENFLADMGERPDGMTLERVNNDGNYEPSNCRWATPIEQARNRRNKRLDYTKALDIAVRMRKGESARGLAEEYGISESLPREIHKGRTWRDAHEQAKRIT